MSKLQLENMTVSSLESLLSKTYDKLLDLELADDPNANAIALVNIKINEIAAIIKVKNETKTADVKVQKEPKAQL